MKTTLIYMDEKAHRRSRHMAFDGEVSTAELIRCAIAAYLEQEDKKGKVRR
jgi:hypothetical protein